jgi:hypothetical protein
MEVLKYICDIVETGLELDEGRVYIYNQKVVMPKDDGIFIPIKVTSVKPFGLSKKYTEGGTGYKESISVNMQATLSIDIISKSTSALERKEEVLMALASDYSQRIQEKYSFKVGHLPAGGQFVNLSGLDGAAIPYRFNITINVLYAINKTKSVSYFDDFEDTSVVKEP